MSLTGVRYLGGLARTVKVKSTRIGQVLDLGPPGIALRGWRTHLAIPWERVARLEVRAIETSSDPKTEPARTAHDSPVIEVYLHDGSKVRFSVRGATEDELYARLDVLAERLGGLSSEPLGTRPGMSS